MGQYIETEADLERFFDRLWAENEAALARGMEGGLAAGAQEAREDAPRQTGNMAEGIGIDERIAASKRPLPGLAGLRDYKVRIGDGVITGVIGFPMEYTQHVIEAERFDPEPALKRTPRFIVRACEVELGGVERRLAA